MPYLLEKIPKMTAFRLNIAYQAVKIKVTKKSVFFSFHHALKEILRIENISTRFD